MTTLTLNFIKNPITNKKLYDIEESSTLQVEQVFETARKLHPVLKNMPVEKRVQEISKINDYIIANREEIITRIVEETGKSRFDALSSEILEVSDTIDYFKKVAPKLLKDKKIHTPIILMGKKSKVVFEPLGTILIITPWNYPFYQMLLPSILAFLSGNASIIKPSEITPLKGLIEKILNESGFIKDAIQVIYGGKETGKQLIDAKPDKIHFTGSVLTGKKIMEQAAKHLIPVDLELGGKDPAIVFEDVNIERTANGLLWGSFTNCGQSCTSIERVYVQENIYDELIAKLTYNIGKMKLSDENRKYTAPGDCDMGCMTSEAQTLLVEAHILDAVQKGAKVLTGGKRIQGSLHFPPTLLVDVNRTMKIVTEETFGPVLPVMKFKTENEAVQLANDSSYGLSASVWSKDLKRAERVAKKIEVGNVSINNCMLTEANPALPFGGLKNSGFGRTKGEWGLFSFVNIKSIIIDKQSSIIEPHWYPHSTGKYNLLTNLIIFLFSRSRNLIKFALVGMKLEKIGSKEKIK